MNEQLLEAAKNLTGAQTANNIKARTKQMTSLQTDMHRLTGGVNLIVYGAPGTGKSRYLEDNYGGTLSKRVVFHPEYTYFDFVGSYKPVPLYKKGIELFTISNEPFTKGEPYIDYQYCSQPFL